MEEPILPHPPPPDLRASLFQHQPCRDIRFMIHISDDNFSPRSHDVGNGETYNANERGRIHAESNLVRRVRVEKRCNALPCPLRSEERRVGKEWRGGGE